MARYYPLNYSTFGADFKAALEDYYGSSVTIHAVEDRSITFSCPKICDKPVKIGTAIPSTSFQTKNLDCTVYTDDTMATGVSVMKFNDYASGTFYGYYLVLSRRFLLLQTGYSDRPGVYSILVANATNGRSLVICGTGTSDSGSNARCLYTDVMKLTQIRLDMMATGNAFMSGNQLLLKPVFFGEEYKLDLNEDGTLAYIDGLYSCGKFEAYQPHIGSNYFISACGIYGNTSLGAYAPGTFYIGLESDADDGSAVIPATGGSYVFISAVELLAANWQGDASPYSQVVKIPGVTANSKIELNPSVEQLTVFHNKDLAFVAENEGGVVTVYAVGQKPENDYTIQVTVTEVQA